MITTGYQVLGRIPVSASDPVRGEQLELAVRLDAGTRPTRLSAGVP